LRASGLLALDRIVALPPVLIDPGSDEHAITGGRGCFTVNFAMQEAVPDLLPSLKFAFTEYVPG